MPTWSAIAFGEGPSSCFRHFGQKPIPAERDPHAALANQTMRRAGQVAGCAGRAVPCRADARCNCLTSQSPFLSTVHQLPHAKRTTLPAIIAAMRPLPTRPLVLRRHPRKVLPIARFQQRLLPRSYCLENCRPLRPVIPLARSWQRCR